MLLSAIALQGVALGLLLIVAFSVGLAGVVTGIGMLLVYARRLFDHVSTDGRLLRALPLASAAIVRLAGPGITLQPYSRPACYAYRPPHRLQPGGGCLAVATRCDIHQWSG